MNLQLLEKPKVSNTISGGISLEENVVKPNAPEKSSRTRPDMQGPSDINDLLSNLKSTEQIIIFYWSLKMDDSSTVSSVN